METKHNVQNRTQLGLLRSNNGDDGQARACFWIPNPQVILPSQNIHPEISNEPIDLTCSKRSAHFVNCTELCSSNGQESKLKKMPNGLTLDANFSHSIKKRGRKRKYTPQGFFMANPNALKPNYNTSEYFQIAENKKAEVLQAAKSLFSKRTRTLFHWMYPDTPKSQLKAAVANSWDTLGDQEKEFYISQVLGRFGFPQTNLMINPQLGSLSGMMSLPPIATPNEELSSAVSDLLLSEANGTWSHLGENIGGPFYMMRGSKKRNRPGRPPGSKNKRTGDEHYAEVKAEPVEEFEDDPELCHEFQQFKWALNLNEDVKS